MSGIKSIIRFYQSEEPSNPKYSDIWYNPYIDMSFIWTGDEWLRVRGERWGPGSDYGYSLGGANPDRTYIQRILFPFNSGTASQVGTLISTENYFRAGCNSSNHGFSFSMQGYFGTQIHRISFPFDSGVSSNVGNISYSVRLIASCNCSTYGYSMGGEMTGDAFMTNIDRIAFPHDSGAASHTGNLSSSKRALSLKLMSEPKGSSIVTL